MKKNMGTIDRAVRVAVAVAFVAIYYFGFVTGPIGYLLLVLAGVFVVTSIIGFCPLYLPMNINTNK